MNINRNNYEEYFLLYADNELSADERYDVELFIEQNTDLKAEFIAIQQTIIEPEEIAFDKNILLKRAKDVTTNDLLLLLDNELSASEKQEVTDAIGSSKELETEFNTFKKVVLTPDLSISFPDKKLLYKKERARIVYFYRITAAAVLISFGLWGGYQLIRNNNDEPKTEIAKSGPGPVKPDQSITGGEINKEPVKKNSDEPVSVTEKKSTNEEVASSPVKLATPVVKQPEVQVKSNNLPQRELAFEQPEKIKHETENITGTETGLLPETNELTSNLNTNTENTGSQTAQQESIVHPTSYSPNESSDNYAFYNVPQEQFRKTKIGSFLKTAKRVITRNLPGGARMD